MSKTFTYLTLWGVASLLLLAARPAPAANGGALLPERPGDERLELPERSFQPRERAEPLPLPPIPPADRNRPLSSTPRIHINRFRITGATVFSETELHALAAAYENRWITSEELHSVRQSLTRYYIDRSYINSGAVIPDQEVANGEVEIRIIEGKLSEIALSGDYWFSRSYLTDRLATGDSEPLNIEKLRQRIQLLQQNPLIGQIQAQLGPGKALGEAALNVKIVEKMPFQVSATFNNHRSPSVAPLLVKTWISDLNLTGHGDSLAAGYGNAEGLDEYEASYTVPFTAADSLLRLYFSRTDSTVMEEPFDAVDIQGETENYGISVSHPFFRTPEHQFTGSLTFERRHSKTYLLGLPFSFSPGVRNGASDITALRFTQEWLDRGQNHVLALRSTMSVGLGALNATMNGGNLPDGRFFAWLAQAQWARRLFGDAQVIVRSDLQLTPDSLLPLEKFAVGGHASVRGYRENQLVRDNGWVSSVEFRIPLFRAPIPYLSKTVQDGMIQLAPFFDLGWSWETNARTPPPETLSSLGLGVRWDPSPKLHTELYWGIPLRKLDNGPNHDLQDSGLHFAVNVNVF